MSRMTVLADRPVAGPRATRTGRPVAPQGSTGRTRSPAFRPDIEGLRAIAVGLVVLFHAGVPFLPGGFVGVDVFFVISGFLITGLVVREMERTGTVSVVGFYARRAKRLLPATAVVLVLVAVASWLVIPVVDRGDVGLDIAAAATYVANWRFGLSAVDYFGTGTPSPLLHFWSLAVEEQFYLVWPWLLLLVTRRARGTGRRLTLPLLGGLAVVAIPSLWWSVQQTASAPGWAYVSSFTRAWELAVGGGIAIAAPYLSRLPRAVAAILGWAGLLAIGYAALTYSEATGFPGSAALVPVLGAAALVAAGGRLSNAGASRLLAHPRMVRVGGVSYSWYLWHWPPLVLLAVWLGVDRLPLWLGLFVAAATYVLATLSKRFVEDPFHRSPVLARHPRRALRLGALCTIVGLVAGLSLWLPATISARTASTDTSGASGAAAALGDVSAIGSDGSPTADPAPSTSPEPRTSSASAPAKPRPVASTAGFVPALQNIRGDYSVIYRDGCHQDWLGTDVPACTYGDTSADRTMVLYGDSHAAMWFPALEQIATQQHWKLVDLTKNACSVADATLWSTTLKRSYSECDQWRTKALARIKAESPALVVTTGRNDYRVMGSGGRLGPLGSAKAMTRGTARKAEPISTTLNA